MGLYFGGKKCKIISDNIKFKLASPKIINIEEGILLLSSDNHRLKDRNGLYLIAKEGE